MDYYDLPEWVWTMVDKAMTYEDTHAPLYRIGDSVDKVDYVREQCPCPVWEGIPAEVRTAVKVARQWPRPSGEAQ